MLIVAVAGLAVNLVSMRILSAGSDSSLNVKGAYLEVWSDMLGSLGVIFAAVVIRFTGWSYVDPIIAVLIGLWVLPRSWTLLSVSLNVLLEGVPEGLALNDIENALVLVPGVCSVHDLHVWAITTGKTSLTAHLTVAENADAESVMRQATEMLQQRFAVTHTTLQTEQGLVCSNGHCGMCDSHPPAVP